MRALEQTLADDLERGRVEPGTGFGGGAAGSGTGAPFWSCTSSSRCGVTSLPPFASSA